MLRPSDWWMLLSVFRARSCLSVGQFTLRELTRYSQQNWIKDSVEVGAIRGRSIGMSLSSLHK